MIPNIILISDTQAIDKLMYEKASEFHLPLDRMVRISPQGAHITIDQIRWLKKLLFQSGGRQMLVAFEFFDTATIEAQNTLLKVLEEYGDIHIVLIFTRNIHVALPTIRSRCVINQQQPIAEIVQNAPLLASIPQRYSQALSEEVEGRPKTREEADQALCTIIATLRFRIRQGDIKSVASCKQALHILWLVRNNNLNPQLALDHWSLSQIDGTV